MLNYFIYQNIFKILDLGILNNFNIQQNLANKKNFFFYI